MKQNKLLNAIKERMIIPETKKEKQAREDRKNAREAKFQESEKELQEVEEIIKKDKKDKKEFIERILQKEFTPEEKEEMLKREQIIKEALQKMNKRVNKSFEDGTNCQIDRDNPEMTEEEKAKRRKEALQEMNKRVNESFKNGTNCKIDRDKPKMLTEGVIKNFSDATNNKKEPNKDENEIGA